ncbi:hypothetical protein V5799_016366 [Amblyomma americanum]|uniref:Uncharacterized protein n=1 Tax=Amblyomma americanum TaxID=6943 RepID=A0AAQ4F6G2_AMBAM
MYAKEFTNIFFLSVVRLQRSFMTYNTYSSSNLTECRISSPCGWFMYHPTERNFVHYLQVCTCPTGLHCLADRDDVSISSWVYSCKVATSGGPAIPPGLMNPTV